MTKMILVGLLALGLLLLATFALAADTTSTATAKDGTTLRCCNHNWADSNNDNKCDTCGMAYEDIAKFNQSTNGGCGSCGGCGNQNGHGHGGNH